MSTSTIPAVLDALVAGLSNVSGLTSVQIVSAPVGLDLAPEAIVFFGAKRYTEESLGMGESARLETYAIEGSTWVAKPGADETAIKVARDQAFAIYACVETYVNSDMTLNGTCSKAEITGGDLGQGVGMAGQSTGHWAEVNFSIEVEAAKAP